MKLTTIWTIPAMTIRERFSRTGEWALREIAHRMPRRLAYWSLIDTGARVTTGPLRDRVVPEVTFFEVLENFGNGTPR